MNSTKLITRLMLMALLLPILAFSQEEEEEFKPVFITVSQGHWNMELDDFDEDEWKAVEAEFFNNVISKNDLIIASEFLVHSYTSDNSEFLRVNVYQNWEDIPKAGARNNELIEAAWPQEADREAFFKKQSKYYTNYHSDEIYTSVRNSKDLSEANNGKELMYYVRKSHFNWPDDGDQEEIRKLYAEFATKIIHPIESILAYYPMNHRWGSDGRDFVEVFAIESLADLEKINDEYLPKQIEAHWPDESKREAFFKAFNRYFDNWHGDFVYTNVPELSK